MKLTRRFSHSWFFLLTSIISVLLFFSCDDDPLNLNAESILPPNDLLAVYDTTLSVELYTVPASKLAGMNSQATSTLGSRNDPRFGQIKADFLADFMYTETPLFIDTASYDAIEVISLTLNLTYLNMLGEPSGLDFSIYELAEAIPIYDSSDYVMSSHMYSPEDLVERKYFKKEVEDRTQISTSRNTANVDTCVVELSLEFAQKFVDMTLLGDTIANIYVPTYKDAFKEQFKGLYFATKPREVQGGTLIQINHYTSTLLLETVQINNADPSENDTTVITFTLGKLSSTLDGGGWNLNIYSSDFNPELEAIIGNVDNQYSKAYAHSLVGPQVLMRIPGLEAFRDGLTDPISISYAELSLPYSEEDYDAYHEDYPYPAKLGVIDSLTGYPILDDRSTSETYLGGIDTIKYQYTLNLGNHVHQYLRNPDLYYGTSFYLYPGSGAPTYPFTHTARGVVLNGTSSEVIRKPSIRIVYSIIPN